MGPKEIRERQERAAQQEEAVRQEAARNTALLRRKQLEDAGDTVVASWKGHVERASNNSTVRACVVADFVESPSTQVVVDRIIAAILQDDPEWKIQVHSFPLGRKGVFSMDDLVIDKPENITTLIFVDEMPANTAKRSIIVGW